MYYVYMLKSKGIKSVTYVGYTKDLKKRIEILEVNEPPERKPGIVVPDVESLVDKLKNEVKII